MFEVDDDVAVVPVLLEQVDGLDGVEVEFAEVVALHQTDLVVRGLAAPHFRQQIEVRLVALVGLELPPRGVV